MNIGTEVKNIVLTAMFIALIFIAITFFRIPNGFGGIIHVGDGIIFLAATLLPMPYAMLAASLGAGLMNFTAGLFMFLPFTLVIKPLLAIFFTNRGKSILNIRNTTAPFSAGILNTVLYFFANAIIFDGLTLRALIQGETSFINWVVAIQAIPGLLIQAGGSVIVFFILAKAMDVLGLKERFGLHNSSKSSI